MNATDIYRFKTVLAKLIVAFACVIFCLPAIAQEFKITESSSKFVTDADFDSVIRKTFLPIAVGKNVSPSIFDHRYPASRERFANLLKGLLTIDYSRLDKRYVSLSKDSRQFNTAKAEYLSLIGPAVNRISETPIIFHDLLTGDNTDRILSFHSDIRVLANGSLEVTETIKVFNGNGPDGNNSSNNDDIKRGIVRDFPTKYIDKKGLWSTTSFELDEVTKNGIQEPYLEESLTNGTRIKTGSKDVLLPSGVYTYQFKYSTERQLIFHNDKDELYWNVNGTGWVFTIDSISCTIKFPEGARVLESACYTGVMGSTERQCHSTSNGTAMISFQSDKNLDSYEGLTVAAAIQKGIIAPPSAVSKSFDTLMSNYYVFLLIVAAIGLFVYYTLTWRKYGKDPKQGVIIPQFEPPGGYLPADLGYILKQQFAPHLFAATLIDAAVHKDLKIEVDKKGWLIKQPVYSFTSFDEKILPDTANGDRYGFDISRIYGETAEKGKYNPKLKGLQDALATSLKERHVIRTKNDRQARGLFSLNTKYVAIGTIILIATAIGGAFFIANNFSATLLVICGALFSCMLITHIVFARIMSAYTPEGRAVADHTLGFKMYLQQAEQRLFNELTPPEKTLDLFEKYLPYAIALEVENEWASKFESILQHALEQGYQPAYYYTGSGFGHGFSASDMSSGISSGLSGTIASASSPPSSSSGGSGGGGSSGGGGGGGGGGGW